MALGGGGGGEDLPYGEREGKGMRGRRRSGVFWSINFKKHVEEVHSGILRRVVKLQWYGSNMMNCIGRSVNSRNCNGMSPINPFFLSSIPLVRTPPPLTKNRTWTKE